MTKKLLGPIFALAVRVHAILCNKPGGQPVDSIVAPTMPSRNFLASVISRHAVAVRV